jgi:hypothetical protein
VSDLVEMSTNLVSLALVLGMTVSAAHAEEKKTNYELRRDDAMAWKMAEKFVLAKLKAPATAKFTGHSLFRSPPSGRFSICLALTDLDVPDTDCFAFSPTELSEDRFLRYYPDENAYFLSGSVDSQNSYGAMIRTPYYVALKRTKSGGWECSRVKFGGE